MSKSTGQKPHLRVVGNHGSSSVRVVFVQNPRRPQSASIPTSHPAPEVLPLTPIRILEPRAEFVDANVWSPSPRALAWTSGLGLTCRSLSLGKEKRSDYDSL